MKVALVHDYIKEYGGAERVLESLHELWPDAPVYTTVYLPQFLGTHRERFADWNIITSPLQNIPFVEKLISPARLVSPWIFENWDFRNFDVIIVSATGAYFPNLIIRHPETLHICYCHTPPRYLYGYPTARDWRKHTLGRIIGGYFNHQLRQIDFTAAQRPDYYIANSQETKRRIAKFYRRDATVIYPPVMMADGNSKSINGMKKTSFYLTGGRLARAKRIDLAIDACNRLKLPLKVFGRGFADYGDELKTIAGPTIEFLGEVSDRELKQLYQSSRAFIYTAEQEDFGIIPVEAQACGIPVIALAQGGVLETVKDGKTGVFFREPSVDGLADALKRFDKLKISNRDCIENSRRFSKTRFQKEIAHFVHKKITHA